MASAAHEEETAKTAMTHRTTDLAAMGTSRGDAVPASQATESEKP
jgi:hypothetical protein